MERLRASLRGSHSFNTGARHIVEHILRRKTPSARLAMGSQRQRTLILRRKTLHELRPDHPRRAHLGHFHEKIHAYGPEEGKPWRELVDVEPRLNARLRIFKTIGQRIGKFKISGRSRFLHVIAGNRNRIELRHMGRGIFEDVRDNPHGVSGRIDIGVAHHEFFQNVILNSTGKFFRWHSLLFASHNEERQNGQHRTIHGHRHGHLVQRNAIKQGAHVIDGINGHTRHAHIARHARMI